MLFLAADGLTDKEIALRLSIGAKTVRTYWDRMRQKLGAASRTQALGVALRTAHEELARAEQQLRMFADHMPVIFVAFDEQMRVVAYNREAERVYGYGPHQVIRTERIYELMWPDPEHRQRVMNEWKSKLGNYRNWELPAVAANGAIRVVAWSSSSFRDPIPAGIRGPSA